MFDPFTHDAPVNLEHPALTSDVRFESHGCHLNGVLLAAGPGPHPLVVLLHGFPGNERNFDLAQLYRRAGMNVLVFHYRGSWGSEGTFRSAMRSRMLDLHSSSAVRMPASTGLMRIGSHSWVTAWALGLH